MVEFTVGGGDVELHGGSLRSRRRNHIPVPHAHVRLACRVFRERTRWTPNSSMSFTFHAAYAPSGTSMICVSIAYSMLPHTNPSAIIVVAGTQKKLDEANEHALTMIRAASSPRLRCTISRETLWGSRATHCNFIASFATPVGTRATGRTRLVTSSLSIQTENHLVIAESLNDDHETAALAIANHVSAKRSPLGSPLARARRSGIEHFGAWWHGLCNEWVVPTGLCPGCHFDL
jgi:hypothetical protein